MWLSVYMSICVALWTGPNLWFSYFVSHCSWHFIVFGRLSEFLEVITCINFMSDLSVMINFTGKVGFPYLIYIPHQMLFHLKKYLNVNDTSQNYRKSQNIVFRDIYIFRNVTQLFPFSLLFYTGSLYISFEFFGG